ncbi:MAG: hypothetical protein HY395_01025 [Candidatus Doudnabacteria bacterium]|nr:hypothetical protein [Candidatus Doudnabacteria bacterium]
MDVLQVIRPKIKPLKASYDKLSQWHKLIILLLITSFISLAVPHQTLAEEKTDSASGLVFMIGDHETFISELSVEVKQKFAEAQLQKELDQKRQLTLKLEKYLNAYNSPLADVASTLVNLKNWKKVVALAAAESSFCRKYPVGTANCWGVGGSELWNFGTNLHEGVIAMDKFLETHPKRSNVKYSKMSFENMNGLYKQPAAEHWLANNEAVYKDLVAIENNIE